MSVHVVEPPPLFRRQRSQHGVLQNTGLVTETTFRVCERGIHRNQCIVEWPKRITLQPGAGNSVPWCLLSFGKNSELHYVKLGYPVAELHVAAQRLTRLHRLQGTLGGGSVGQQQVFERAGGTPLAISRTTPLLGREVASELLRLEADLFQMW